MIFKYYIFDPSANYFLDVFQLAWYSFGQGSF